MATIGIIIVIWIVCLFIASIVERIGQGIRDRAAHKVLDSSFDYQKEKTDILSINNKFSFSKKEVKKTSLAILAAKYRKKNYLVDFINSLKKDYS